MASGDYTHGQFSSSGTITGTGAAISVVCGFKPKAVWLYNVTGEAVLHWNNFMADDKGYKGNGLATGSVAAPVFTGTSAGSLNLAAPAFSGTGLTAAGQVITTTDNQTMTLNQCAGMWLLSATATTVPNLILSNTAVTGAPAVLTVQGSANTDAGAYKILKNIVPVGTNTAPAFTGGASDAAFIASGGITPSFNGFSIGTDTDVNVIAEVIHWVAVR